MTNVKIAASKGDRIVKLGYMVHNGGGTMSVANRLVAGWTLYNDPELSAKRAEKLALAVESTRQYLLTR